MSTTPRSGIPSSTDTTQSPQATFADHARTAVHVQRLALSPIIHLSIPVRVVVPANRTVPEASDTPALVEGFEPLGLHATALGAPGADRSNPSESIRDA